MALLDTPVCNFGWKPEPFTLADPDGVSHSLPQIAGEKGTLVAFICNHCPYVVAVIGRFVADAKTLQSEGIGVIAVMSNDYAAYPADAPDKMKRFADHHDFTFPYVIDETSEVARAWDAVCTPDFFGFNADMELQYRGRIDECRPGASAEQIANRTPELLNAMRQIAATGEGPRQQIPSAGCSIKWR